MTRHRRVALLIETSNSYGRELLWGIRAWMRENASWAVRFVEQGRGASVPGWLGSWPGDGIIARVENSRIETALRALRLPVVDVSAALVRPAFPQVLTDSRMATRLAVEHLCGRGLRRFAYCGDSRFLWSRQREGFFREHLAVRGFTCAVFRSCAARPETELAAMARWLKRLSKPLGVLACYDIRGHQVIEACHKANLRVPDEVAVMGIHNDELLCELCDPPLTSIAPDARRAGYEAAELLAHLMERKRIPAAVRTIEPIGVVTRQSTDMVAVKDPRIAAAVRFIRERACEGIRVGDVLRAVPMARTRIERLFQQQFGCTPRGLIEQVRLARVKDLLARTTLPIARIAEEVGYPHPEYMTVAFRRVTGTTPRAFRARHGVPSPENQASADT